MSLWSRIRARLGGSRQGAVPGEPDAPTDSGTARTRATGGVPQSGAADSHSTTGTTPNERFVGRPGGDDPGDSGATGADVRGSEGGGAARPPKTD
jgi:hypothetical protein